jgi:hypothetical protein
MTDKKDRLSNNAQLVSSLTTEIESLCIKCQLFLSKILLPPVARLGQDAGERDCTLGLRLPR